MITLIYEKYNTFNPENQKFQEEYDKFIKYKVDLRNLKCSCGKDNCFTRHAYYRRTIKTSVGSFRIKILRVKCTECNCTHAIMMPNIVPYSQVLLDQHVKIVNNPISKLANLMIQYNIEEPQINYIKSQYTKHWKHRLHALKINIDNKIPTSCFHHLKKQFMQIRNTTNIPFIMSG